MRQRKTKATHFVPNVVFRTAFAGVVPICVAASACGGGDAPVGSGQGDAGRADAELAGVAACAFQEGGCVFSVAAIAFDAAAPPDAAKDATPDYTVGVACMSFTCLGVGVAAFADGGDGGDGSAPKDGGGGG
jgi:hypothetical protein